MRALRALGLILAALALLAGAAAPPAPAADPDVRIPPTEDRPPAGHRLSAIAVAAIADRVPKVRAVRRTHRHSTRTAFLKGADRWQVSYFSRGKEIAQVVLVDRTGAVAEAWTGFQVAWTMARGYPGAFGRRASALYVWLPLCALFLLPFLDPRRLRRWLHLDLLVLLALSVSLAFFSHGRIGLSVPLVYPVLLYLLVRMLALARRPPAERPEPLKLLVPASWLAIALLFLVGFRVGLNVTNSNVIDVGYSGVVGAHKIAEGKRLYGAFPRDDPHGDTYGPVTYLAYVPAERAFGWSGRWDDLPAAHAAAVLFDLFTMLGLWLLGRRLRGPTMGLALAYAWATYPFTLFCLETNSNDGLVALLVVGALLAATSPAGRGALGALAGLAKFAPLALAPLLARGAGAVTRRGLLLFAAAFALVAVAVTLPVLHGDARLLYDRTLGFQASRGSPFSVWGLYGLPHAAQILVEIGAVVLAVAVAFLPRRTRGVRDVAALSAAVLIALQLGVTHWFYLYVTWFFAPVLVALLCAYGEPVKRSRAAPA
ncbi:MAG: hypothetical protein QOC55_2494 [Thermoleophilaceae bacterium]|nr:hypothetical protein [Thermoleophilaceae bacterium]